MQIIWLDSAGTRVEYDVLASGSTFNVKTFTGAAWMVAGPSSNCLAIFGINGAGIVTAS